MKNLFIIVSLMIGVNVANAYNATDDASDICMSPHIDRIKAVVYENFMNTSQHRKHQIVSVYQAANLAMASAITNACTAATSTNDVVIATAEAACKAECDKKSSGIFHSLFGSKAKEKELYNECAQNCISASQALRFYVLGKAKPGETP